MKKKFKRAAASALCVLMMFSGVSTAFAAVPAKDFDMDGYIISAEDKPAYVEFFNNTVNALKADLPNAKVSYTAGIPENGISTVSEEGTGAPLNAEAQKYLGAFFDGMFSESNSTFRSLLKAILGDKSVKNDSFELHRGAKRDDSIPVYGKNYVSALVPAADFDIHAKQKAGSTLPTDLAVTFVDTPLADADKTSLPLAFSLPDGSIDAELISGKDKDTESFLNSVKFDDFTLKDARIVTKYDKDGKLSYYGSAITYNFSFSYFEGVKIMSAILGIDIYKMCVDTVDTILSNLGRTDISAETILLSRRLDVTYTVTAEISDIDYTPRYFGDITDDGAVNADDARAALRHAVGLDVITATEDQLYADIDFDGDITTADARLILRTAVQLEEPFSEVPEGKEIKIIVIEQEHSSDEPETEDDPGKESGGFSGLFDFDPAVTPAGLAQLVFDVVDSFKGAEGSAVDIIKSLIEASRSLSD